MARLSAWGEETGPFQHDGRGLSRDREILRQCRENYPANLTPRLPLAPEVGSGLTQPDKTRKLRGV